MASAGCIALASFASACSESGRVSGGACVTNQNCPTGEQCVGGRCLPANRPGCKNDDGCGVGEFCNPTTRVCETIELTGCSSDEGCPPSQRCNTLTGVCIQGRRSCTAEAQCTSIGKHCDLSLQQCVDCALSMDCPNPLVCIDGSCVDPASSVCTSDSGCNAPSTICQAQQCVPGCHRPGSPVVCGLGEFCNSTTGRCTPGQVTCSADTGCTPPATICESGQCIPGCTQVGGLQCTGGNVCNNATGRCEAPSGCATDAQCGAPAGVCEGGRCVPGCGQPAGLSCGAGTVCNTGAGRCVTIQGPCQADAQCGSPTGVCESGQCVPGCGQAGGVQCSGNSTCNTSTGRCAAGGPVCTSDANCNPPSTICNTATGACVAGCGTAGCTTQEQCNTSTGRCTPVSPGALPLNSTCTANTDCGSGVCFDFQGSIGRRCIASCGRSVDCPASFTCYDYNGAKMCISAQLFTGASFSTPNGGSCSQGGECKSNFCPNQSQCVDTCSENSDCGASICNWYEFATDLYIGACNGPFGTRTNGASCSADSDCESGVCYGQGTCGDLCGSTADCPNGNVCSLVNYSICAYQIISCLAWQPNFVKACVQISHGIGAVGTSCSNGATCRSGLCYTTASQCTDMCSRDGDCPSTHVCGVEEYGELDDGTKVFANVCKPRGS